MSKRKKRTYEETRLLKTAIPLEEVKAIAALSKETPERSFSEAKLVAMRGGGPYSRAVEVITAVETESVGTFAVDPHYRVYYNPKYLEKCIADAEAVSAANPCKTCGDTSHGRLAYVAGIIWHESQHPLRRHHMRVKQYEPLNRNAWALATDFEINDEAVELFTFLHDDAKGDRTRTHTKMCLPPAGAYPENYGYEPHLSAEEYYRKLCEDNNAHGMSGVIPGEGDGCGSGANGEPQEYEEGPPTADSATPGVSDGAAQSILKEVADACKTFEGRGGGAVQRMVDWADGVIPKSKYNYKKEISKCARIMASNAYGFRKRNYRKFGKRSIVNNFDTIHVGTKTNKPLIMVVTDASGSMMGARIRHAMGEVEKILKTLRGKVLFAAADWDAGELQQVKSLSQIQLTGGGGTSMKRGVASALQQALEKLKVVPDLLILITDGDTDWPTEEEMGKTKLLIILTREQRKLTYGDTIPKWAKVVWVPTGAEE